ncbi:MAG: hypothetical protein M1821_007710 [Bathelium mastoideum]|nr:MAG: hypothetical protein M1821_007710 [Bathelium mastoideum]
MARITYPAQYTSGTNAQSHVNSINNHGNDSFILQDSSLHADHDLNICLSGDEMEKIEKWLSPLEFEKLYYDLKGNCVDTGDWLFNDEKFQQWHSEDLGKYDGPQNLHLYGELGSGKTFYSTRVVTHLLEEQKLFHLDFRVLHLLLDPDTKEFKRQCMVHQEIKKEDLIGGLLRQLLGSLGCKLPSVRELFNEKKQTRTPLEWQEACLIWREEIGKFRQVYLVIDGLDKYPTSLAKAILNELYFRRPKNLSVLLTSRDYNFGTVSSRKGCAQPGCQGLPDHFNNIYCPTCNPGGRDFCTTCIDSLRCQDKHHQLCTYSDPLSIYVSPTTADIELYLGEEAERKEIGLSPEMESDIITGSANRAGGNFIIAKLFLQHFPPHETRNHTKKHLLEFPEPLKAFYDDAVAKIVKQERKTDRELGLQVLSYVSQAYYSHRALTVDELRHLLAMQPGSIDIDEGDLYPPDKFRSVVGHLITIRDIDVGKSKVLPFNNTVSDFLLSFDIRSKYDEVRGEGSPELDLGMLCLSYLNCTIFESPCKSMRELCDRIEKFPFAVYAAQFWGDHVRESLTQPRPIASSTEKERIEKEALKFLNDISRLSSCTQIAWFKKFLDRGDLDVREGLTGLHLCAWFGLESIIPALLSSRDSEVDIRDETYSQTPLMYACRRGKVDTVHKLLELGADVNAVSSRGRTALFEIIDPQLYTLDTSGGVIPPPEEDDSQNEVLEVLIGRPDLDVNVTDVQFFNRTPLMLAVLLGQPTMVRALLPRSFINRQDAYGATALALAAAFRNDDEIANILLSDSRIDVNVQDYSLNYTALVYAAEAGNVSLVENLLVKGANPNHQAGQDYETVIMRATTLGRSSVVRCLLQSQISPQAQVACKNNKGQGLFHAIAKVESARDGHIKILELLHPYGLDVNAQDDFGMTPLHHACRQGCFAIINSLMRIYEPKDDVEDHLGRSPYTVACQYDQEDAQLILSTVAAMRGELPIGGETLPLWAVVKRGEIKAIKEACCGMHGLSDHDAEPGIGKTVLHLAVETSNSEILQFLLSNVKQSPNTANLLGRTPLHSAAYLGDESCIRTLLDYGAKIDVKDRWGYTPLSRALSNRKLSAAVTLFEFGADLNLLPYVKEIKTQTLFFKAVSEGRLDAVRRLFEKGADKLARMPDGQSAIELAMQVIDGDDVLKYLESTKTLHCSLAALTPLKNSKAAGIPDIHSTDLAVKKDVSWSMGSLLQAVSRVGFFPSSSQPLRMPVQNAASANNDIEWFYTLT